MINLYIQIFLNRWWKYNLFDEQYFFQKKLTIIFLINIKVCIIYEVLWLLIQLIFFTDTKRLNINIDLENDLEAMKIWKDGINLDTCLNNIY